MLTATLAGVVLPVSVEAGEANVYHEGVEVIVTRRSSSYLKDTADNLREVLKHLFAVSSTAGNPSVHQRLFLLS